MKYISIIMFFLCNPIYSQMIGDTRATILELENKEPCEIRGNQLMFCYQGYNNIIYGFNSKKYCAQITKISPVSKSLAEKILAEKLRSYNTKPVMNGNRYVFFFSDSHTISYSIINNPSFGTFIEETEINFDLLDE